jgi:hypothetical protein
VTDGLKYESMHSLDVNVDVWMSECPMDQNINECTSLMVDFGERNAFVRNPFQILNFT